MRFDESSFSFLWNEFTFCGFVRYIVKGFKGFSLFLRSRKSFRQQLLLVDTTLIPLFVQVYNLAIHQFYGTVGALAKSLS